MTPLRLVGWVLTGLAVVLASDCSCTGRGGGYGCGSVLAPIQHPGTVPFEVALECEDVRAGRFLWALFVGLAGFALMVGLVVDRVRARRRQPTPGSR